MKTWSGAIFSFIFLGLVGCASKPAPQDFGFIDKAGIDIPMIRKGKNAIGPAEKASLVFGKTIRIAGDGSTNSSWSCKMSINLKWSGNTAVFGERLREALLGKKNIPTSLPQGDLFVKSPLGKIGANAKPFAFRLEDLEGRYRLRRLTGDGLAFVNEAGFYFSGFVKSEKQLDDLEVELELDSDKSESELKNALCSEVETGVRFRP